MVNTPSTDGAVLSFATENPGFVELGFAKIDTEREARTGLPEVIYAPGKTKEQLVALFTQLSRYDVPVIATRIDADKSAHVLAQLPHLFQSEKARILARPFTRPFAQASGVVAVVTAGTSDIPVAEEAAVTLELMQVPVTRCFDVGVAGLHRLMHALPALRKADAIIVAAGMEGALPSVVGGLVKSPVIAVPTSVGYGANYEGLSALLGMMNSCAPGVSTVNIDNGFGAAICAYKWLQMAHAYSQRSNTADQDTPACQEAR